MYHAAGLIVIQNSKILMVTRKDGKIGIPGGKKEEGEIPIFTAVRETYEETGLVCVSQQTIAYRELSFNFPNGVFYTFQGTVVAGSLRDEPGHKAFWLNLKIFLKNPNIMAYRDWNEWAIKKFNLAYRE